MELITILSTIILIATISTFILSIGAYILYKIRSRREQKPIYAKAGQTQAELVTVKEPEEWKELKVKTGKANLRRVRAEDLDEEIQMPDRKSFEAPKQKVEESELLKHQKRKTQFYQVLNKESNTGDLQWK